MRILPLGEVDRQIPKSTAQNLLFERASALLPQICGEKLAEWDVKREQLSDEAPISSCGSLRASITEAEVAGETVWLLDIDFVRADEALRPRSDAEKEAGVHVQI